MHEKEYSYTTIKVVVYGDSQPARSLISRFADNTESSDYFDFKIRGIEVANEIYKLQMFPYLEDFSRVGKPPFRGAHAIIIPVDVTDRKSFDSLSHRIRQVDQHSHENAQKHIVATNVEDVSNRVVSQKELQNFAKQFGPDYSAKFEVSAKTSENIEEFFTSVVHSFLGLDKPITQQYTNEGAITFKDILRGIDKYTNGELKQSIMERKLQEQTNVNGETWASKTSKTEPQVTKGQILEMLTKSFPETLKKYSGGAGALLTAGLKYANEHAEERSDKERCVIC